MERAALPLAHMAGEPELQDVGGAGPSALHDHHEAAALEEGDMFSGVFDKVSEPLVGYDAFQLSSSSTHFSA
jgi:hypothetical protein